jgi:transposase
LRRDDAADHDVVALDLSALPDEVRALIAMQAATIARLQAQLARLRRMQFGRSSERLASSIAQLELALEDLEEQQALTQPDNAAPAAPVADNDILKPARRPLPEHLPRETINHPTASVCPCCGGELRRLGEDVTEVLDYRPASFRVIRHVRVKFSCRACETITQAPAPSLPIRRGRASAALLAHVLTAKFCDHLPLHRQSDIYARAGVTLERSTLADWVGQVASLPWTYPKPRQTAQLGNIQTAVFRSFTPALTAGVCRQQKGFRNPLSLHRIRGVTHTDKFANLPTDADALRALVVSMSAELEAVTLERNALTAERDGLLERLERQQHLLLKLSRMQFGRKSERLPEDQLPRSGIRSSVGAMWRSAGQAVAPSRRSAADRDDTVAGRHHLPVLPHGHELDRRGQLATAWCDPVAMPSQARQANLVARFADHQPLYRQAQMMSRQSVPIERSTLAFWMGCAAAEVAPVIARLREIILSSAKPFADETIVPVLDPGRGRTEEGYFWAIARDDRPWGGHYPPAVVYSYAPGQARQLRPRRCHALRRSTR